jgi:TRAP-type C4-dicarboxylate transport system permease large subunit
LHHPTLPLGLRVLTGAAAVLVFVALLVALGLGISPNVDTQLVRLGEWFWPGYANELRMEPREPTCDLAELDAKLATCPANEPGEPGATAPVDDPFGGDDPFAEPIEGAPSDPGDPFAGDDPFAEPGGVVAPDPGDPFAGDDPFAEPSGDAAASASLSAAECGGLRSFRETCASRWESYEAIVSRLTPTTRAYRFVEVFIGGLARFPYWKHLLVLFVVLGAISTTAYRKHIALRDPRTSAEHMISQGAQLVSYLLLLASNIADWQVQMASDAEREHTELPLIWAAGFAILALISLSHLVVRPAGLTGRGGVGRSFMVVPLFAYMAIGSGLYFLLVEQHPSGQAIYLHKFLQVPSVYLGIGLYIWAGMLFSITRVATLTFGVLRPLGLPPVLLAWLVVVLAAVPTAYSGASGIFVLAAGGVVFTQLRQAGASTRISLAATAMSGSLGVVLAPCLVVVLIATLNNEVTTAELFHSGLYVFALSAVLALGAFWWRNDRPLRMPVWGVAGPAIGRALLLLAPFAAIGAAVIVVYRFLLGTSVTEHTAMLVLPAVLLAVVIYDRRFAAPDLGGVLAPRPKDGLWRPLVDATAESSEHIGALLMLMTASICLGGVVERTEVMDAFPASLGGPYLTMIILVVVMVLVGMTMDALGAVVLVSVSIAGVAYQAGIHPVHFWMMVLVAFELGYLTPPVALNHLLARQVIGEESHVEDDGTEGFWARHEHIWLPMAVMAVALVVVAFVPFALYSAAGAP